MKDYLEKLQSILILRIKEKGYPLLMQSNFCYNYKKKHNKCNNCESEQGCARLAASLAVFFDSKDKADKTGKEDEEFVNLCKKLDKILEKETTLKELKKICLNYKNGE